MIGISTACLYPLETENALDRLLQLGFRRFEVFLNSFSELEKPYLQMQKRILDGCGAAVRSIHPFTSGFESFLLFSDYIRRFHDGEEFYKRYFEAAAELGASIVVLHGQKKVSKSLTEEQYFERYEKLYQLGRRYHITLAQENVNLYRSESPDFIRRMRCQLGESCAFVLDIKQSFRAGSDPFVMAEAMADRLVHVHLNDRDGQEDCLLPGRGSVPYQYFFNQLQQMGYSGDYIIEVYRKNFNKLSELVEAACFLKSFSCISG